MKDKPSLICFLCSMKRNMKPISRVLWFLGKCSICKKGAKVASHKDLVREQTTYQKEKDDAR